MYNKERILTSWIMTERLSDGDIKQFDKDMLTFHDIEADENGNYNFYDLFKKKLEKVKAKEKGIAVFFDIFNYKEVIDLLNSIFHLTPPEELTAKTGDKFSFLLYFDKSLELSADKTFFTENAYIRHVKKFPKEDEFLEFEEMIKHRFAQDFDETADKPLEFNIAMKKVLNNVYGEIDLSKCRMQVMKNPDSLVNFHSFFINDLEKARKINTPNLKAYLMGNSENRINLDCKDDQCKKEFIDILQPENYPLGRFPSSTKNALSFMQQIAVNLSCGVDRNNIRSVNGPPGTGKTTLLKDIFAELIVKQAYDISKLSSHEIKGTDETVYFTKGKIIAKIGEIPPYITENSIVVASSNNGAVQNIVNELPLKSGVDNQFLDAIIDVDYFKDLSNSTLTEEWQTDKDKKTRQVLVAELNDESKNWGLFSLEGGRSYNMTRIKNYIMAMCDYFQNDYSTDDKIYNQFISEYDDLKKIRKSMQDLSKKLIQYKTYKASYEKQEATYHSEKEKQIQNINENITSIKAEIAENEKKIATVSENMNFYLENEKTAYNNQKLAEQYVAIYKKPTIFSPKKYKNDWEQANEKLRKAILEKMECSDKVQNCKNEIIFFQNEIKSFNEKITLLQNNFEKWDKNTASRLNMLKSQIENNKNEITGIIPIDMNMDYESLQHSNPWFGEDYRIAQSNLMITALKVRKQFLYDNRKNLKAASIIWSQQDKEHAGHTRLIKAAWNWFNMAIPVISSTFASFSRMCRNIEPETLGHLFIDEAGQALPQASVGAIFRSRHVMVVGDPSQIKPVMTLEPQMIQVLRTHFDVSEKYLSENASTQTLVDSASHYGFYRDKDKTDESWIGIPLWVHRRSRNPMFTISNVISYGGLMVIGEPVKSKPYGKSQWYDITGHANNKYVEEQGEFLKQEIMKLIEKKPKIIDKNEKDKVYVITPFSNVASRLAQKLRTIGFTRYKNGKPTNVGTIHTFQGKEAPIVFMVLGADKDSGGAAAWAVSEPNMMNVAATRAKEEFYVIGDKSLYSKYKISKTTLDEINKYNRDNDFN